MAITISGENNNDRITAQDGVIDTISGFNIAGIITASSFTGDLTGDVTGNLTGNVTGNINNSTLLLQTGGTERLRIDQYGRVMIGTTTVGDAGADDFNVATTGQTGITIRSGTGSGGQIYFADGTSGDDRYRGIISYQHGSNYMRFYTNAVERLRIDSSGRLLLNTTSGRVVGSNINAKVQLEGAGTADEASFSILRNSASEYPPYLNFGKSRASSNGGSNIVQNNDTLGQIRWSGADGNDLTNSAAAIYAQVDGTPGTDNMPGRLQFATTHSGGNPTERLRITSGGRLQIGSSNLTGYNQFNGPGILSIQNNSADGTVDFSQGIIFTDNVSNAGTWTHGGIVCTGSPGYNGNLIFGTDGGGSRTNTASGITEKMRITHDGKIGINQTSPDYELDVTGRIGFTVQIRGASGSQGTPSYAFDGDHDTGMFRNGINNLCFATAGLQRLTIDENGKLGLGVNASNPSYQLQIQESVNTAYAANATIAQLAVGNVNSSSATNAAGIHLFTDGNGRGVVNLSALNNSTSSSADFVIQTRHSATLAERLRIKSDGKIGINEVNPTEMLHIKAEDNTDSFGGIIVKANNNSVYTKHGWRGLDSNEALRFAISGTEKMRLTNGGKLALGRTSADEMMHITNDDNTDNYGGIKIGANNGSVTVKYGWRGIDGSETLRFAIGGSEKLRIDSNGSLSFAGDTDTYIHHPEDNEIAITCSGGSAPLIRFGTGGNNATVGIKTDSALVTNGEALAVRGYCSFKSLNDGYAAIYTHNEEQNNGTIASHILMNWSGANRAGFGIDTDNTTMIMANQNSISFKTGATGLGGTEKVRIPSDGGLELKTDGRGVKFPNTQTPRNSNGNRVGISSEMRYYETGTFVPGLSSTVLNSLQIPTFTDASYARRIGRYVRCGHLVFCNIEIKMASTVTYYQSGISDATAPVCITNVTPFYYAYANRYASSGQPDYNPCNVFYSSSGLTNDTVYACLRREFPGPAFIQITKPGTNGSNQFNSTNYGEVFPANATIAVSYTYAIDTDDIDN